MRLLILGINHAPEIISIAVYTSGLAKAAAKAGHDVQVITAQPYFPAWKIFETYPKFWYHFEPAQENLRVIHCPHYVPNNPTGARRILHHLSFAISAAPIALWYALTKRPDLIMVIAPSLISAPIGWLAAKLSGAKTWLHIQDFEVEAAFATGLLNAQGLIGRLAKRFEAFTLRRFDKVSTISAPMLQKLREKTVPESRLFELRNWANLAAITPQTRSTDLPAQFGIKTNFTALYSGNLANKQGLEILPEVARLLAHREDITLVICGDGPLRDTLMRKCSPFKNTQFFPLQPIEKLSDLLGMADVHLLPQIAQATDLMLPSKLTNMLASGRPVIATTEPNTALADEVIGCGEITPPGDAAALAQAIETLIDNKPLCEIYSNAARARAIERWDSEKILSRFLIEAENLSAKSNLKKEAA
ncbi:MAG: WcaI family glycosyltransferase [Paracoccaceae bacterium]